MIYFDLHSNAWRLLVLLSFFLAILNFMLYKVFHIFSSIVEMINDTIYNNGDLYWKFPSTWSTWFDRFAWCRQPYVHLMLLFYNMRCNKGEIRSFAELFSRSHSLVIECLTFVYFKNLKCIAPHFNINYNVENLCHANRIIHRRWDACFRMWLFFA